MQYRTTELEASAMLSERIVQKDDGFWYFRVRGNATMGPYANYREAQGSLERYIESCQRQSDFTGGWPRWLHPRWLARRFNQGHSQGQEVAGAVTRRT